MNAICFLARWWKRRLSHALVSLLSPHADRHAGDISATVCFSVCFSVFFVCTILVMDNLRRRLT